VVNPPPIYIQEKVHPKAIIDGLQKEARSRAEALGDTPDLFADFNGLNDPEARLEFYQHDQHWSNRMILARIIHRTARNRPRPPNTWARDSIAKNFIKQPIRIVVNDINGLALIAHFS